MRFLLNDTEIQIPDTHREITLGQRIDFHALYGADLKLRLEEIGQMEDGEDQEIALAEWNLEKMFSTFAFFANCTVEAVRDCDFIDTIATIYEAVMAPLVDDVEIEPADVFLWNKVEWVLPSAELQHGDPMTFGEFIDAKQLMKDHIESGSNGLDYLLKICAIFLRKRGESYQESFLYDQSERIQLMRTLPLDIAMAVADFFDRFNEYVSQFPVFQPSRIKGGGKHSREHYNRFGWINFLKTIASTKVFDLPGMNSIEAARASRLFDVLVWASEEKELGEAMALDMEEQKAKMK